MASPYPATAKAEGFFRTRARAARKLYPAAARFLRPPATLGALLFFCLFTAAQADPGFKIDTLLQRKMVLQQGKEFRMWGKATQGMKVTVTPSWGGSYSATADSADTWVCPIGVIPAVDMGNPFMPRSITVACDGAARILDSLLFGEVWMCLGQSNMSMTLLPDQQGPTCCTWGVLDYQTEINNASYPDIRAMDYGTAGKMVPWHAVSPATAGKEMAVPLFFAEKLFAQLNVPVGLIYVARGGYWAHTFVSKSILQGSGEFNKAYYANNVKQVGTMQPSLMYDSFIYPSRRLSIKGFLWYQGESNSFDGMIYARLIAAMVKGWRQDFNQGDLPFYYVQLPRRPTYNTYPAFREVQDSTMLLLPNSDMVCTMDLGDTTLGALSLFGTHYRNKRPVGERLAAMALHREYGKANLIYSGPRYAASKLEGANVRVTFNTYGSGLRTSDGKAPQYFCLVGPGGYPADTAFATATITGNDVVLSSPKITKPVAVYYAYVPWVWSNVVNTDGLPAYPFRCKIGSEATLLAGNMPRPKTTLSYRLRGGRVFLLSPAANAQRGKGNSISVHTIDGALVPIP